MMDAVDEQVEYVKAVGKEPTNFPPGSEAQKQWDYRGTIEEKRELFQRLGIAPQRDPKQESLF